MCESETHIQRLEDSLDLNTGDLGEPGSSQVTFDKELQVDRLENFNIWLRRLLLQAHSMSG